MKKRVLSLLSCALILVTCFYPRRSYAILPALAAAPEVAGVLADIAISAGLVVTVKEGVDHIVNDLWGGMTEDQQQALSDATYAGRWVIDSATGAYKYVVDLDDGLWSDIKTVVDGLFDAGENTLTEDGTSSVSLVSGVSGAVDTGWVVPSSLSPITLYFSGGYYYKYVVVGSDLQVYTTSSSEPGVENLIFTKTDVQSLYILDEDSKLAVSYEDSYGNIDYISHYYEGIGDTRLYAVSFGSAVSVGTVYGDSTAIDVPDYDWNNKSNNKKSFPFRPAVPIYNIPSSGASSAIDYDTVVENLVDMTADELALQDVTGIDTSVEDEEGNKPAILDVPIAIKNAIGDLFTPDEATLGSFQDMLSEKLPIISDLQNWGSDFLDVLNNPTQFSNRFTLNIDLGAGGGGKYGDAVIPALNTDCYLPYKPLVDDCIVGFAWLVFLWNLYGQIPSIINGGSSALHSTSGIQEMVNKGEDE